MSHVETEQELRRITTSCYHAYERDAYTDVYSSRLEIVCTDGTPWFSDDVPSEVERQMESALRFARLHAREGYAESQRFSSAEEVPKGV